MLLSKPSLITHNSPPETLTKPLKKSSLTVTNAISSGGERKPMSPFEARLSLVLALASQTSSVSQRRTFLADLGTETAKYVFPKRFDSRNLEEALMAVPDLETVKFKVLRRTEQYEIREVENTINEKMEMTTPVFTRKTQSDGEKMEMTTPVITKRLTDETKWQMSFVMPSKYGSNLPLPKDPSIKIREVPKKVVAVVAFSGFVTDEEVQRRESKLRIALKDDRKYQVKEGASVEVAQYNPPFTLPFQRRNEIALEVERREE
ncbi:heme-binding-like protein At3g10130, chloroplastic isoform X3 [Mangifera indica]|uniref:heme-binding-like protein At3g10130, chloroplastic isoform X3 n=1 Tax=Mangifera indica TaxID=29780 RepID=UPI001CFA1F39|nr:heme-binding-like protein At3g10130, chloroplastic isoform X3 [Mangifera indica]